MVRLLAVVVASAIAAAVAVAQGGRDVGETYEDWVVGCDNGLTCKALSLNDGRGELSVERTAGPRAVPLVMMSFAETISGTVSMFVDGREVARAAVRETTVVRGAEATAFAVALASGASIEVRQGPRLVSYPSLKGAAAALRYMDEKQGRTGTVTALAARGPKASDAVPSPVSLPVIQPLRPPRDQAQPLTAAEQQQARTVAGCGEEQKDEAPEVDAISDADSLVLIPCGAGPYNSSYRVLIATGMPGRRRFAFAEFDAVPAPGVRGVTAMVYNPVWNADEAVLSDDFRGRGIGDCGSGASYVWDCARFRRVSFSSMWECRGSSDRITLWRATLVR
ncbi:MAG TPA: DUF1176 domain-containing protein [Vicinamibacterales bacterium]|nr:DUF1176 domain-containing protein [Vicinamibacterales bacterium]